jgi:hypothetical protein
MAVMKLLPVLGLVACTSSPAIRLDAGDQPGDAQGQTDAAHDASTTGSAYSHTIVIDGVNDFTPDEAFTTTTATYGAHVTWDVTNIYVGYTGDDIAGTTESPSTKWLFVYIDADPGASTGSPTSEMYNTEQATFPSGFGAEYYARWKCDGTFSSIQQYGSGAWTMSAMTLDVARSGNYVELAFPRSLLGGSTKAGVLTYMLNEEDNSEGQYAGIYVGNFTDGYAAELSITEYLAADFTSSRVPNDTANVAH